MQGRVNAAYALFRSGQDERTRMAELRLAEDGSVRPKESGSISGMHRLGCISLPFLLPIKLPKRFNIPNCPNASTC